MTCKKCEAIQERKGDVIYSDPYAHAVLPSLPATKGHIKVYSKNHAEKIEDLDPEEVNHLFQAANIASTVLFETLGAQGSNIILNEDSDHLVLNVIARRENDGIDMRWEPKESSGIEDYQKRIKDQADMIGHNAPKKNEPKMKKEPEKIKDKNPMVDHLHKLP